ncbi:uncharacterized protein Triagg1_4570 [Trichoderma aggressivum f. europaeum]|uniref:SNF2 N-terminal domain-containing protein n=1 Tax=Trichoderma aggressivum f. europaeum TaxID=173218 RepID=A0AAE1M0C6_9HYPO|nr:hypothetical protein Triagg1_4570 [Trichoderma aggressivum f. europaeum]
MDFTLSDNHRARVDVHDWTRGALYVADMKIVNGRNAYSVTVHQRVIATCAQKTEAVGLLFDKLDSLGHVFLSSKMGLGKTKTFAATVEAMARDIESRASPGDAVYLPTLVLNPVPAIHQTRAEFKRNFPGLNVVLCYSVKSQVRKFGGANVVEKGRLQPHDAAPQVRKG